MCRQFNLPFAHHTSWQHVHKPLDRSTQPHLPSPRLAMAAADAFRRSSRCARCCCWSTCCLEASEAVRSTKTVESSLTW